MSDQMKYDRRGVSATKDEVHAAIKHLDKGIFPNAFCKVLPDIVAGQPDYCNVMHADTAGTKTSLAWLYWKETNDASIWRGIVQDAIVMNIDDMGCIGCVDDIVLSSTIGRNKNLIPGEVIAELIQATADFCQDLAQHQVNIHLAGGETADVGDIVRTVDVGFTTFARMQRDSVVVNNIRPGQVVVGLASYGQASYEQSYNSGIGSNGLTSARHDVLSKYYAQHFPDSFDPNTPEDVVFCGPHRLTESVDTAHGRFTVGQLLLSPTRTYLPFLRKLLRETEVKPHGIIHCSGGGQTKVQKFIQDCHIIKDNLFAIPPVFDLIQKASGTGLKEMYQVFNMGHRLELYLDPEQADTVIALAQSFNIDAQLVGRVVEGTGAQVSIHTPEGIFTYA
jgi:phosphoribosylformylglycinamidine cyclo-ligase